MTLRAPPRPRFARSVDPPHARKGSRGRDRHRSFTTCDSLAREGRHCREEREANLTSAKLRRVAIISAELRARLCTKHLYVDTDRDITPVIANQFVCYSCLFLISCRSCKTKHPFDYGGSSGVQDECAACCARSRWNPCDSKAKTEHQSVITPTSEPDFPSTNQAAGSFLPPGVNLEAEE
jgi:hypothetical protein